MSLFYKRLSVLPVVLAVALSGCSDTAGPTGGFTVAETSADLAAMQGAFETEAFQSLAALGDNFSSDIVTLSSASAQLIQASSDPSAGGDVADASARVAAALGSSAPIPLLQHHAGKEFIYDPAEGHYVVGQGAGPTDGIRFILYAVNPVTEEIAEPLTQIGHVEIIDLSPAPNNQVSVQVTVVSGSVTYADYTVSATLGATSGVGLAVDAEGYLTDGTTRADFSVSYALNFDFTGARVTIDYSVDIAELGFGMDVSWVLEGTEGQGTVEVDARLTHEGNFVTAVGSVVNGEGEIVVRVGSGSGEGELFATITISPTGFNVVGADGEALSESDAQTLREIWEIIEDVNDTFEDLFDPVEWAFDD